jgi:transcriptional regulator with XRE-family HTH domain
MSLFSKNLRFLRKKGNHKQDEIAILFNKRANTIGNWENQKSEPGLEELMKLGAFFKVSPGDLLQKDLENESIHQIPGSASTESTGERIKSYSLQEPLNSLASAGGPDAFWFILRELRGMNEKVDLLIAGMESTAYKSHSDKSYH